MYSTVRSICQVLFWDISSIVRVPSIEAEDARRIHRERERLIKERIQHVNRIKGLLATQGIYEYEPLRRDRIGRFEALKTAVGTVIPRNLRYEIRRHLQRLELVLEMVRAIEAERGADVKRQTTTTESSRKIQQLVKLKAIGPQFASVLVGEVFHKSFANRRQVASYAGLSPSPFNSGNVVREQGISKAGNPRARTTMVEMAWIWLRYQFTSTAFTGVLKNHDIRISMDGKGRCMDNIFVERLWRSLKYEEVYLKAYDDGTEARAGSGSVSTMTGGSTKPLGTGHRAKFSAAGLWI